MSGKTPTFTLKDTLGEKTPQPSPTATAAAPKRARLTLATTRGMSRRGRTEHRIQPRESGERQQHPRAGRRGHPGTEGAKTPRQQSGEDAQEQARRERPSWQSGENALVGEMARTPKPQKWWRERPSRRNGENAQTAEMARTPKRQKWRERPRCRNGENAQGVEMARTPWRERPSHRSGRTPRNGCGENAQAAERRERPGKRPARTPTKTKSSRGNALQQTKLDRRPDQ